jgi:hypothetical protein
LVTVNFVVGGEFLIDNGAHYIHFTGIVSEEEIVASLLDLLLIIRKAPNNINLNWKNIRDNGGKRGNK